LESIPTQGSAAARRKAAGVGVGVGIQFDQGFGDDLPYPEASFDRVFSSFMFHHLPADEKGKTLRAVRRVLKPGGKLHLLDFEGPADHAHGFLARLFHSHEQLIDNSESEVVGLMRQSGFTDAQKTTAARCCLRRRILPGVGREVRGRFCVTIESRE